MAGGWSHGLKVTIWKTVLWPPLSPYYLLLERGLLRLGGRVKKLINIQRHLFGTPKYVVTHGENLVFDFILILFLIYLYADPQDDGKVKAQAASSWKDSEVVLTEGKEITFNKGIDLGIDLKKNI